MIKVNPLVRRFLTNNMKRFYQSMFRSALDFCHGRFFFSDYPKGWAFATVVGAMFSHLLLVYSVLDYSFDFGISYQGVYSGLFLISSIICFLLFMLRDSVEKIGNDSGSKYSHIGFVVVVYIIVPFSIAYKIISIVT